LSRQRFIALLAATLMGAAAAMGQELPLLVLEPGALAAWHIVRARVESVEPITTRIAIVGRTWEGKSRLLFETKEAPGLPSFDVAFWIDDDIGAVSLVSGSGSAAKEGPELAVPVEGGPAPPYLPFHSPHAGIPPASFLSLDPDPGGRATEAADRLFVSRPPIASFLVLLALFLSSLALAAISTRGPEAEKNGRRRAFFAALQGALVLALGTTALLALPGEREIFIAALPAKTGNTSLALRESIREGWTLREWGEGPRRLVGARLWPGRYLPLDLILGTASSGDLGDLGGPGGPGGDRQSPLVVFSEPPLIVGSSEGLRLEADSFLTGWIIDE